MKRYLPWLAMLLVLLPAMSRAQGTLQRSVKKTLFIFPIDYSDLPGAQNGYDHIKHLPEARRAWVRDEFFRTFVSSFQRFDFIDMQAAGNVDSFLTNANAYLEEHARDLVQKRKKPDGRIGEARVTLDDLKKAVENGYVFVPVFTKVKQEKDKKTKEISYSINAHIDIYRTVDGVKVVTVEGGSDRLGAVLGAMRNLAGAGLATLLGGGNGDEKAFKMAVQGVFEEMKTKIRKENEFSLKAVAFDTGPSSFRFDLGRNFGVNMDRRYKTWSLDEKGRPYKMEGFGKVRHVHPEDSEVQVLIGSATDGDQVIEDARFGLNISADVGILPWRASGFNEIHDFVFNVYNPDIVFALPPDENTQRASLGLQLEYNTAWLTNVSELYVILEGGFVPVPNLAVWHGMVGLRKKVYYRRLGLFGSVKAGAIGVNFIDTGMFDKDYAEKGPDARVYGVGVDTGAEWLFTPDLMLRGQVGFVGFPDQVVLIAFQPDGSEYFKTGRIRSVGLTFNVILSYTI